jgi:Ser/Thr protein kinase RdoA (MazF antagonist)
MSRVPASAADHPELFAHFSAEDVPERSMYPFSPVFPCRIGGRRAVLKHTRGAPENARAVAAVTRQWAAQGVAVVTPLDLEVANPARLGEVNWVAYPVIAGRAYTGQLPDVAAAGELIGRMHAARPGSVALPAFRWPDYDQARVGEDVELLRTVMGPHAPARVMQRLVDLAAGFMAEVVPPIRDGRLPQADASMDYKANNLVYTAEGPVLVDPDNGDFAPRLLDLAQAALLFHTEHEPVSPRPFDAAQWTTFIRAYLCHVNLTDQERALWPLAIEYMLAEEGHWAFTGEPGDWQLARQKSFLLALAQVRAGDFPLP